MDLGRQTMAKSAIEEGYTELGPLDGYTEVKPEPIDVYTGIEDPNEAGDIAKKVFGMASRHEVPLSVIEQDFGTYENDDAMLSKASQSIDKAMRLPGAYPISGKTMAAEAAKGVVRFAETAAGRIGGTTYDWLGQFISEGGHTINNMSQLGNKDRAEIYNPYAQAIIAAGENISAIGKDARQRWAYSAATGWEAMDPKLAKADPIAYAAGRISEGVTSSALAVLSVYISGGAAAPALLHKGIYVNRGLLALAGLSAAGGFEHAEKEGENFLWSSLHGLADGSVEYAMESSFLDEVGRGGKALTAGRKEATEELFTGLMQNIRAGMLEGETKGLSAYDAAKVAVAKALKQAPWEVAAGFIGGYGIQGGANLVDIYTQSQLKKAEGKVTPEQQKVMDRVNIEVNAIVEEGGIEALGKVKDVIAKGREELGITEGERPEAEVAAFEKEAAEVAEKPPSKPAQPPKVVEAPAVADKQVWEMTKDELKKYYTNLQKDAELSPEQFKEKYKAQYGEKYLEAYPYALEYRQKTAKEVVASTEKAGGLMKAREQFIRKAVKAGLPVPAEVLAEYPDLAQPPKPEIRAAKLKGKITPIPAAKPPKPKPIQKLEEKKAETRDILGGVDPIQQIHRALKEAVAVQPLTEAAKKAELRRRVGAAAGTAKAAIAKGIPVEEALRRSTALLKGPLTEYDQVYESIADILEPGAKNEAELMIWRHPELRYLEKLNTDKSFNKLIHGAALTPGDVENIERVFGKAFRDITEVRTTRSGLYEKVITLWKAGLLTGLKTSGLNIMSTASHAMSETAKDIPASFIDSGISLFTKERTVAFTAKGYGIGFVEGVGKGWSYMKTGYDTRNVGQKYDYKKTVYSKTPKGRASQAYTEFIFHLLGAEDQPFYYGALSRSLYSQSIAQAKTKGLKGKELRAYVDKLQQSPTDRMLEWARQDAETAIYTNRTNLGDLGRSIQKVGGGDIIAPFTRTPSAVSMQIVNYSPIGIVKEIAHQIHKGEFSQRNISQAGGRSVIGTGTLYLGTLLFAKGLLSLGYPKNERERKLWEVEGRKPNSIKIDGKWRDIQAFGPAGNLLIIGGYFQQALDSKGSPTEAIVEAMAGGGKSFTEQTFVRGVNLAVDALVDPEASFERWFTSMAGSVVPTLVADIARAQDDISRRAVGPKERIQSRIPIYRKGLPSAIDIFGQDLPRYGGNVLETMADPTRPSKIRQDVVVDELRRLWDKDIKVSPTKLGDKKGYDILTVEENTFLWQRSGELVYKGLFGLIDSNEYRKTDDFAKGKVIAAVVENSKAIAKAEMVNVKLAQGKTIMKLAESGLLSIDSLEMLKYYEENK